jgi:multicomponent Na+:H+ antiporter subunit A
VNTRSRRLDRLMPGKNRPLILETTIRVVYHSILVLSLYFLFAGHNHPGGGFVGGLMVGAAISLRYLEGGAAAVQATFIARPHMILGTGLFVAALTALVPVISGGSVLEHGYVDLDIPLVGHVKLTSTLAFDTGVFLVVIGLVLMAFEAFGEDFEDVRAGDAAAVSQDGGPR